jgi:molybdopterin-binding protein
LKLSARNQLKGRVTAVRTGEIMAEIEIAIEAAEMTAVITRGSVTSLDWLRATRSR